MNIRGIDVPKGKAILIAEGINHQAHDTLLLVTGSGKFYEVAMVLFRPEQNQTLFSDQTCAIRSNQHQDSFGQFDIDWHAIIPEPIVRHYRAQHYKDDDSIPVLFNVISPKDRQEPHARDRFRVPLPDRVLHVGHLYMPYSFFQFKIRRRHNDRGWERTSWNEHMSEWSGLEFTDSDSYETHDIPDIKTKAVALYSEKVQLEKQLEQIETDLRIVDPDFKIEGVHREIQKRMLNAVSGD